MYQKWQNVSTLLSLAKLSFCPMGDRGKRQKIMGLNFILANGTSGKVPLLVPISTINEDNNAANLDSHGVDEVKSK